MWIWTLCRCVFMCVFIRHLPERTNNAIFCVLTKEVIYMKNITSYATDYALQLGMSPALSGFDKFVQAVAIYASSPELPDFDDVCKRIGKRCSMHYNTVEHAVSYALKATPNLLDKLYELTGYKLQEVDIRPKYIVCLVAQYIKRDVEEIA